MNIERSWKGWMLVAVAAWLFAAAAPGQQPAPAGLEQDPARKERPREGQPREGRPREGQPPEGRGDAAERPPRTEYPERPRPPGFDPAHRDARGDDRPPLRRPGSADLPAGRMPPFGGPAGHPRDGRPLLYGEPGAPFPLDPMRLEEMKRYDPEMYALEARDHELENQTRLLAQQLHRAPPDQREQLRLELQDLVQKHFDARQTRRELQLKRLEAELEQMRASLARRQEVRDQIIGRRIAELTGDEHDFDF